LGTNLHQKEPISVRGGGRARPGGGAVKRSWGHTYLYEWESPKIAAGLVSVEAEGTKLSSIEKSGTALWSEGSSLGRQSSRKLEVGVFWLRKHTWEHMPGFWVVGELNHRDPTCLRCIAQ